MEFIRVTALLVSVIASFNALLAQTTREVWYEAQPKGMQFIPEGSLIANHDSSGRTIKINSFWMSNEITNIEFRAFTDFVLLHPNDSLFWIELDSNKKENIKFVLCRQILPKLIDSLAMAKEYPLNSVQYQKYKKYFTAKEFDNYPVVGISQAGALYFCIWKTEKERNGLKKRALFTEFRLPLDEEWAYAASLCDTNEIKQNNEIKDVLFSKSEKLKLCNFFGNVSEMTNAYGNHAQMIVVRGASWKQSGPKDARFLIDKDTTSGHMGFRVVKTFMGK